MVTANEMKYYDESAINYIGIPSLVLMERAALSALEEIIRLFPGEDLMGKSAFIMSGTGNNGADGLALARLLCEKGFRTEVACIGNSDKASKEWLAQRAILNNYPVKTGSNLKVGEYNILIDALFGVGLSREVRDGYAEQINCFNACQGIKLALDIPSGIHADNGNVMGCAVKADITVTFSYAKRGLFFYPGCEYAGKVITKDIGISENSFLGRPPGMFRFTENVWSLMPTRSKTGNKGTFGKVLLAAGSKGMAGAAILAAKGAYRTGAGMVKVASAEENRMLLQQSIPEALFVTWEDLAVSLKWADIIAVGPGIGTGKAALKLLYGLVEKTLKPLVIDADGLNLLAADSDLKENLFKQAADGREVILTPHMGELARLFGYSITDLKADPTGYAIRFAEESGCVIVSKDARTLICKKGRALCLNTTGNSGMATAGSGDVLTGIIAGLLAQGYDAFRAAAVGTYCHGTAGDKAAGRLGEHGVMAGDIADDIAGKQEG